MLAGGNQRIGFYGAVVLDGLWPNAVNVAPRPWAPPGWASITGSQKQLFISSTRSQARRYDMPNLRPAREIDPVFAIASRRPILPGPTARPPLKSIRNVTFGISMMAKSPRGEGTKHNELGLPIYRSHARCGSTRRPLATTPPREPAPLRGNRQIAAVVGTSAPALGLWWGSAVALSAVLTVYASLTDNGTLAFVTVALCAALMVYAGAALVDQRTRG